jgi:hypothetical protein
LPKRLLPHEEGSFPEGIEEGWGVLLPADPGGVGGEEASDEDGELREEGALFQPTCDLLRPVEPLRSISIPDFSQREFSTSDGAVNGLPFNPLPDARESPG